MEKSVEDDDPKPSTVKIILKWIISKELSKKYHVGMSNCFFFAHNLFTEFANVRYPIEFEELNYEETAVVEPESIFKRVFKTLKDKISCPVQCPGCACRCPTCTS